MKTSFLRLLSFMALALGGQAQARWNHQDSAELNRMTGLGPEYYNDLLSYRDPRFWDDIWSQTSLGLRTSAGSLNQKEFIFQQSLRLRSSQEDTWQVAYTSDRVEESRRIIDQSAVELSYGSEQDGWRIGILGDAETEKAFMDLGMSLSYEPRPRSLWQVIGWSVDTAYAEKKLKREDYRTRKPWSWELLMREHWGNSTVSLRHEQDEALVWYLISEDQRYEHRRQVTELRWIQELNEGQDLFLQINRDSEREGLAAFSRVQMAAFENERYMLEAGQHLRQGNEAFTVSLWGLWDRTEEDQSSPTVASSSGATRHEAAFVGYWSKPFWKGQHQQHWAVTVNEVRIREKQLERSTEVKIIWSPDFILGPHARMRLTTTWHLDQLADDFPYTKAKFHPWGGGQASFLLFF